MAMEEITLLKKFVHSLFARQDNFSSVLPASNLLIFVLLLLNLYSFKFFSRLNELELVFEHTQSDSSREIEAMRSSLKEKVNDISALQDENEQLKVKISLLSILFKNFFWWG